MTSEYENIYSRFLLRVTDFDFSGLSEHLARDMMNGWLKATLSRPYVRRLFSALTVDDDGEMIEFELRYPVDEVSDQDFIEEVLAEGMVVQWLTPKVQSVLSVQQIFTNSEQQYYSQSAHLKETKHLLETTKANLRKMIRDRGYFSNSYISEEV